MVRVLLEYQMQTQKQVEYDAWITSIINAVPDKNAVYVPQYRTLDDMIKLYGHLGIDPEDDVQWGAAVGAEVIRD
jgi:hypothetical protein